MSPEALASDHHHTVTQLSVEALVVELLENMLEMTWKVHNVRCAVCCDVILQVFYLTRGDPGDTVTQQKVIVK